MQFVLNHWYLFLALILVLVLLIAPTAMQLMYRIQTVTPAQCVLLINRQSAIVVDISEPNEYKLGHLPNSVHVPASTLGAGVAQLDKYKERPVVVVARNNQRALKAATTLRRRGFNSVTLIAGGLAAWEKENLPLEK